MMLSLKPVTPAGQSPAVPSEDQGPGLRTGVGPPGAALPLPTAPKQLGWVKRRGQITPQGSVIS